MLKASQVLGITDLVSIQHIPCNSVLQGGEGSSVCQSVFFVLQISVAYMKINLSLLLSFRDLLSVFLANLI